MVSNEAMTAFYSKRQNFGRYFLWQAVVFYFQIKKYPGCIWLLQILADVYPVCLRVLYHRIDDRACFGFCLGAADTADKLLFRYIKKYAALKMRSARIQCSHMCPGCFLNRAYVNPDHILVRGEVRSIRGPDGSVDWQGLYLAMIALKKERTVKNYLTTMMEHFNLINTPQYLGAYEYAVDYFKFMMLH